MVLCQVYTATALNNLLSIGINGHKKIRIVRIDYAYTAGNDKVVQLQSNILRIPYGNTQWFTMSTNPNHQISNIHDGIEFDTYINGNLDLSIVDVATGVAPVGFTSLSMLLDINDAE